MIKISIKLKKYIWCVEILILVFYFLLSGDFGVFKKLIILIGICKWLKLYCKIRLMFLKNRGF